MSLILKRQKFPLNRQICPFGYLIISIFLEVKALLQIQMQMQLLLPFTIQRIERVRDLGIGIGFSVAVSFASVAISYL